jgi:uncharacterized protein DUF3293
MTLPLPPVFPAAPTPSDALPARPQVAPPNTVGPQSGTFLPPDTPWQRIQNLPLVGRGAADQFRADLGRTWQAIKERMAGYGAPTSIPVMGLAMGAANLTGAGGPEARAAAELSPEASRFLTELEGAVGRGSKLRPFALLTADRPGIPPEILAERHAVLGDAIREAGFEPIEHGGGVSRDGNERGYLVPDMKAAQARHLGARFGQDAVITHDAYHDLKTGQSFPLTTHGEAAGAGPHTVLPSGKRFAMHFDFDHPEQTGTPEPVERLRAYQAPEPTEVQSALQRVGQQYRTKTGLTHAPLPALARVSPEAGRDLANAYDVLKSAPNDPKVQAAYRAFVDETHAQASALKDAGFSWSFVDKDPYKNSTEMLKDLETKHINVLRTAPGTEHPLLTNAENDEFRAVHDILGHGQGSHSFGPTGEENAYRAHAALYTPTAQRALATETRGQNSWFNFGPHADLPVRERPFAQQKAALFPHTGEHGPSVLGASEPKYAYRYTGKEPKPGPTLGPGGILSTVTPPPPGTRHGLPLADEDVRTLGVAGRYLLQKYPDQGSWVRAMQDEHPNFAPHLEGNAGERAYAVAKRAKLPPLPSQQQIEHLARSPTGESTRPWYHTWWPAVKDAFGEDDGEMLTRFHAVLSAQAEATERNPGLSLAALHDYKAGDRSFSSVTTTPERREALQRLMDAGPTGTAPMAKEGRKVNNFYLALKGHPEAVTLDSHMAQTYLGKQKLSPAEYDALDARVRSDAKEAGVSPRDYQAMIWGGQTKYPFQPPEHGLWNQLLGNVNSRLALDEGARASLLEQFPRANAAAQRHALRRMVTHGETAPSHAAVQVGTETFEVPMSRGHAGALERAIEEMRGLPGYQTADDVMADARDGYTMGDGRFIPREHVENLHSSDFIRGKRAHPDDAE